MTWEQVQEFGRDWGWLSGPAVAGLWLLVGVLRWTFRTRPPAELTEPARSLVVSLLDHGDVGWHIDTRSDRWVTKGTLTIDSLDGELLTLEGTRIVKLGYLKEYGDVKKAAQHRLRLLQEVQKAAATAKMLAIVSVVTGAKR